MIPTHVANERPHDSRPGDSTHKGVTASSYWIAHQSSHQSRGASDTLVNSMVDHRAQRANPLELFI